MSAPDVLAPATLGPVRLRNRVIKAATYEGRTRDSYVTDELIEFHQRFAAGGVGMTTIAYCAVSPEGRTERDQIYWRPEVIPGLRKLADAIHAEGAAVSAQIGHAGPVADERSNRLKPLSAGRFFNPMGMGFTKPATPADLDRIVRDHAAAATMAIDAGFDAVEIHLGHNYLISSFLSPKLNHRRDAFGGSLENRARLAREVCGAVREAAGSNLAVLAKLNLEDGVRGGFSKAESLQVAQWLDSDGSLDALEMTAGSSLLNPMYLFKGPAPVKEFAAQMRPPLNVGVRLAGRAFLRDYDYHAGYLLEDAKRVLETIRTPLILLGGVADKVTMDRAMAEGFSFVALGRALIADPDLVNRLASGEITESRCIHCNRCMPTIYTGTRCVLDD